MAALLRFERQQRGIENLVTLIEREVRLQAIAIGHQADSDIAEELGEKPAGRGDRIAHVVEVGRHAARRVERPDEIDAAQRRPLDAEPALPIVAARLDDGGAVATALVPICRLLIIITRAGDVVGVREIFAGGEAVGVERPAVGEPRLAHAVGAGFRDDREELFSQRRQRVLPPLTCDQPPNQRRAADSRERFAVEARQRVEGDRSRPLVLRRERVSKDDDAVFGAERSQVVEGEQRAHGRWPIEQPARPLELGEALGAQRIGRRRRQRRADALVAFALRVIAGTGDAAGALAGATCGDVARLRS